MSGKNSPTSAIEEEPSTQDTIIQVDDDRAIFAHRYVAYNILWHNIVSETQKFPLAQQEEGYNTAYAEWEKYPLDTVDPQQLFDATYRDAYLLALDERMGLKYHNGGYNINSLDSLTA